MGIQTIKKVVIPLAIALLAGCGWMGTDLPLTPTTRPIPTVHATSTTPPMVEVTTLPIHPITTPASLTLTPSLAASPSAAVIEVSPPQRLVGHSDGLGSLAFSPDGTLLASTGVDRTIRLWELNSGQQIQFWQGGSGSMTGLDFSPGGQQLASVEENGSIAIWDVASGQSVRNIDQPGLSSCGVAFSPDGAFLVSGHVNGLVRLWETENWELARELSGLEALSCTVEFSPDGRWIAAGGGENDIRIFVWEVSSGEVRQNIEVYSGEPPQIRAGQTKYVYRIAFSPDSTLIASAHGDRNIRLWEADSGTLRYALIADREKLSAVDFSPDGNFLISGGIDGSIRLWDVGSGQQLANLPSHNGEIYSVIFSPVDWVFASAGESRDVLLWRVIYE